MPSATQKSNHLKVPEILRGSLDGAQARLASLEEEAEKVLENLKKRGKESRKDLAVLVQRLSKQDWKMDLRVRVSKLREQGAERAHVLRGRAESLGSDARGRLHEVQSRAVEFLGVATREQVKELSRVIGKLSRRMNEVNRPRPPPHV